MKEKLQALRDALLERVPRKNYTPEQKNARIKKTVLTGGALCLVAILLLTVALFPVTNVEIVSNSTHYQDVEILNALDASGWTPVLSLIPPRAQQRLMDKLLYLDDARVTYVFPSTLQISVSEQVPLYYFYYDTLVGGKAHTGWLAVGPDLRVVDAARTGDEFAARGMTKIALPAPVLDQTKPGRNSTLRFTRDEETGENAKTEQDYAYIAEFLLWLEQSDVADRLTSVDLRQKQSVKITLDSQYRIEFGRVRDKTDFMQKLTLAERMLESDIDPDGKYIVSVSGEYPSLRGAGEIDLNMTE